MKRTVAIGFIGATLDRLGKGAARWQSGGRASACASSRTC